MTEDTSTISAAGLDRRLLDILACPICKGPLVLHPEEEARTLAADDPLLAR